jgi:hypothetical protein
MLGFSDEELDALAALATALPPHSRSDFLRAVAAKLADHPNATRGPGTVHRVAREVQIGFLNVAVGQPKQRQTMLREFLYQRPLARRRRYSFVSVVTTGPANSHT